MNSIDIPQETKLNKRVFAMAGSSLFKYVTKAVGTLAIIIPILALTGCGEGDGPVRIQGTPATPLPPGFEAPAPSLGVFSETHTDPVVIIQDIQQAGNEVLISTERVRVFEGDVSLGLTYTAGGQTFGGATILFEDADVSAYNTLKFSIDTSSFANFANLTVQLEPPGGGTDGAFVGLSDYTPVATDGNWETYAIPLADLPLVNLSLVNKLGFFNARDGGGALLAGTLYLDDIHFTVTDFGGSGATGTPIDPEVVLYATEGDPDLTIPDVTDLGSGSVINLLYADDDTYGKVLSVFSGTDAGANVARVGFIGFDPGFVTFYEDLVFKIKGMPNFVVFVTLYEDGDPVRINLTSSDYSDALENGWYQVSIPISSFTGLTTATGIVFESDNTASMQFTMLLNDIGFTEPDDNGGNGGGGDDHGAGTAGVFTETATESTITVTSITNSIDFSGNNTVANDASTAIPAFEGGVVLSIDYQDSSKTYGGAVLNFGGVDLTAYDTLNFTVDTSGITGFADLTIQLEPPGEGAAGTNVQLSAYSPVATSGNWATYAIPLADFTATTFTAVNNLGFWNPRSGTGTGAPLTFGILYVDDVYLSVAGSSGGGGVEGNIVPDGGFETAGTGGLQEPWFVFENGGTVSVSSANSNGGTYAARLQADASSGTPSFPILKVERLATGSLSGGESVTVSFDVIDVDVAGVGKTFVAELFTERADPPGGATNEVILGGYDLTNSWATRSFTTSLGADAAGGISLLFKADCGGNTACTMDVFIDNVSIVIN